MAFACEGLPVPGEDVAPIRIAALHVTLVKLALGENRTHAGTMRGKAGCEAAPTGTHRMHFRDCERYH